MPKGNPKKSEDIPQAKIRPALTPEARENQLIALAIDEAERRILDGTATSTLLVHFLKLATTKERLEKEIMEKQKELLDAKTKSIRDAEDSRELYAKAIAAMRMYSGNGEGVESEESFDEDIF